MIDYDNEEAVRCDRDGDESGGYSRNIGIGVAYHVPEISLKKGSRRSRRKIQPVLTSLRTGSSRRNK